MFTYIILAVLTIIGSALASVMGIIVYAEVMTTLAINNKRFDKAANKAYNLSNKVITKIENIIYR